jgi:serine/threonine protein kinase
MTSNEAGTCEWLTTEIAANHLVERQEIDPIVAAFRTENPYADAAAFAEHLIRRGVLTKFQATRLLDGQGRGLVLGPYVLVDQLGVGSMGTVYKALGRADRKPYAVKVLPARGPWNVRQARKKLQQFPEEAHAGVVPWLDVGTSVGLHYLVWPFVEGETLEAVVARDGPLSPARAAVIGVQLAQILRWCERHNVWHGAIKPTNVILGPDGQTKLLDFGVGVLLAGAEEESMVDTLAETGTLASLVDCTAPECVADPGRRSVRGDQYSVGCTLYFGLTGRYPFPDGTTSERMLAHQRTVPTPVATLNPGVPPALAAAIGRLLEKVPEARYNHTDELIAALSPLARQSAVYVPPPPPPTFLESADLTTTPTRPSASLLSATSGRLSTPPPTVTPLRAPRPSFVTPSARKPSVTNFRPPQSKIASDALPPTPPVRHSTAERLRRKLLFWRAWSDPVACTLLAPPTLAPGVMTTIQVVLHRADRSEQARSLPDWRGTQHVPESLGRGESVGMQLRLQDAEVLKPLATIEWNGYSSAALYTVRVPDDWPIEQPVLGTLLLGRNRQPFGKLEFTIPVAEPRQGG